jgi:hypothetical protein
MLTLHRWNPTWTKSFIYCTISTGCSLPWFFCLPQEFNCHWFSPNSISVCSKHMSHIREVYFLRQVVRTNLTKSPSQNCGSEHLVEMVQDIVICSRRKA